MPIHNNDIARIFNRLADLLEIKGANEFRVRSYRNAANTIRGLSRSAAEMIEEGRDLSELPGIGTDLAGKINTIVKQGKLPLLEKTEKEVPGELSRIMDVGGLGAKKVKALHENLHIKTISDLEKAAEKKKIRELEGFGKKTEKNILQEMERINKTTERISLAEADEIAREMVKHLKKDGKLKEIAVAGSFRRRKETVGDLDMLVTASKGNSVMKRFTGYEDVDRVVSKGKTKSTVILRSGFQVDLRIVAQGSYGSALFYLTGSKEHNIAVRKIAVDKNLKLNEYGIFKGRKRKAGKTEKEVYNKLGLSFIEPELRENRGEIEAARNDELPDLISLDDIRGDLHAHTKHTDGHFTAKEMAEAAKKKGYDYIGISDHSRHVSVAKGLTPKRLRELIKEIEKVRKNLKGIEILKGIEVDILEDGSLDLPDDVLKELDFTVCSVHYKFNLSRKKQTERILKAMDNKYFNILGHPTGRMINSREPYDIDMEKIFKEAKDNGCAMEINAHPERLDLNDAHSKMAMETGVPLVISTDAHSKDDLDFMGYGVGQARRGWLEKKDVLNTLDVNQLKKRLKRS